MDSPANFGIATKTVALVGHSAAGKSSCVTYINANSDADMDVTLGTRELPNHVTALKWLSDPSRPAIVAVSNHEEMLKAMNYAKLSGECPKEFGSIHFVYLHKPKDRLKRHLAKETAGGASRPLDHQEYTLEHYDRFHRLFTGLAQDVIDCSTASIADVARRVRQISLEQKERQSDKTT